MILPFGENARAWARRFEPFAGQVSGDLIVVDPSGASSAFLTAIETKKRGEAVIVAIALDEPRSALAWNLAAQAFAQSRDTDERTRALDAIAAQQLVLGGRQQTQMSTIDPRALDTLRDFVRLADVLVVRSWTEAERYAGLLGFEPGSIWLAPVDPALDLPRPSADGSEIVIWAPEQHATQLTLIASALSPLRFPIRAVCKGGAFDDPALQVAGSADAATALAHAGVVVDTSLSDPHNAIALSRLGYRVVSAVSSGAHEYLDGAETYLPWDRRTIAQAVAAALGRPPAAIVTFPAEPFPAPALRADGPLVSLVVRTYNRPRFLERALGSIAAQTYRNVEAVVVNDAGEPVDEIVARFPFARLIDNPTNLGTTPTANVGLRAARGAFVGLLDDDDMLFTDHVSRLVGALERSNVAAASSHAITCYLELNPLSDYAV
ncbi:MAG: glycosyltransferase family 2 protein, partial [Candidatus Eremiobacteraeota bacterium]|nr:glycosyltransferase family 2 protein [Candidatus Eremiobacteraeota bacterium]